MQSSRSTEGDCCNSEVQPATRHGRPIDRRRLERQRRRKSIPPLQGAFDLKAGRKPLAFGAHAVRRWTSNRLFACNGLKYRYLPESRKIRSKEPSAAHDSPEYRCRTGLVPASGMVVHGRLVVRGSRTVAVVRRSNLPSVARAVKHEHNQRCDQAIDPKEIPAVGFQPAAQPFQANHSSKKRAEHAGQTGEKHASKRM